jgi:hypothetical protein
MLNRINRFFAGLEWRWSLGTFFWTILFPAGSFALPAWATKAAGMLSEYAPLSWVATGFLGLLCYSLAVFLYGTGRQRSVRSRYDAKFMLETGGVDPLAKVFEGKRIYLNDFVLPSNPFVDGKNFVDCEIVGPANIFLQYGNGFGDMPAIKIDAVALPPEARFYNGYTFTNCNFRGCTFHRVTFFWSANEAQALTESPSLNWISTIPKVAPQAEPTLIQDLKRQHTDEIEEDKLR